MTSYWERLSFWFLTCSCLVAKSCLSLCNPMNCSMLGFPILHYLPEFAQTRVHWLSDAIQPSHFLSPPPLLALSLSQCQVFSNESVFPIRSKYWGFSISPSKEWRLISFRIDRFDLFAIQGALKNLVQHHNSKASMFFSTKPTLCSKFHTSTWLLEKL